MGGGRFFAGKFIQTYEVFDRELIGYSHQIRHLDCCSTDSIRINMGDITRKRTYVKGFGSKRCMVYNVESQDSISS